MVLIMCVGLAEYLDIQKIYGCQLKYESFAILTNRKLHW